MSDPTTTPATATPPASVPASVPAPNPDPQPGPVPYARFQEVNQRLQEATARLAELGKAQQATQALEQRLAALETERNTERAARLRLEVVTKKGLPANLATRLQGDTPEALEADADALLAIIGQRTPPAPGVPPSGGPGGRVAHADITKMTPAQVREARKEGRI